MNFKEYTSEILKTKNGEYDRIFKTLQDPKKIDILHSCLGLTTEVGEIVDTLKRHIYYGSELDIVNIEEEAGDICWYFSLLLSTLGISFDQVMQKNIDKLRKRYGDKFSKERALNRDLDSERQILEQTTKEKKDERSKEV